MSLSWSKTGTIPRIAALLGIAAGLVWGWHQYQIHFPNYEHTMTELTRNMRPICVGHFLVDIPAQAKLEQWGQMIYGMGKVETTFDVSIEKFRDIVKMRELELRNTKHKTEGSVLHEVFTPDGLEANIFVYRDDEDDASTYFLDGYLWRDSRLFKLGIGSENDNVEESKKIVLQDFAQLQPRDNTTIPTAAGTCIDGGFIPGKGYRDEDVGVRFSLPDYPTLSLMVNTATTDKPDTEGLIARHARGMPGFNFNYPDAKFKYFRKTKRTINQMTGEELSYKDFDEKEGDTIEATWEYDGVAHSGQYPAIDMTLSYGGIDRSEKPKELSVVARAPLEPEVWKLNDEQVLALWDTFAKSIRLRPGAF